MYVCVVWTILADLAGDVCGRHLPPNLRESSRVCAGVRVKVCGRRLRVCVCAWYVCERISRQICGRRLEYVWGVRKTSRPTYTYTRKHALSLPGTAHTCTHVYAQT